MNIIEMISTLVPADGSAARTITIRISDPRQDPDELWSVAVDVLGFKTDDHVRIRGSDWLNAIYAVVKVDRPVVGRTPLPLRHSGIIADDEELVLIGHPLGLPTKIAARGKVLDNTPALFFKASTDSYGGGSGSAVIGAHSGLVEGVLVRGEKDFMQSGDCWVSKVCPEGGSRCRGEDVSRATELAAALDRHGCE